MEAQKTVSMLATLSILTLAVACNDGGGTDRYAEGFAAGKAEGYKEGYDAGYDDGFLDGDAAGYARAEAYFETQDYAKGFADGKAEGITVGYSQGYNVGKSDGIAIGYTNGYNAGYTDGDLDGYERGYDNGYEDGDADGYADGYAVGTAGSSYTAGYNAGYTDGDADGYDAGLVAGYDTGYDAGFDDGYDVGYDAGFDDGYGLSVGPTPKLKGYANVLSMFHNDVIDYSKIKAPKQTNRGLVANGQLLLSETSLTNKDTLKKAAIVEQYLLVEMAKQVKGKFGLSNERSLQVAKAANHFRKYSSKRALTAEDTNAYSSELLGADFKTVEKAFESSRHGDLSGLNSVMEKAAEKNGVTPEKMLEIVTKNFI